MQILHTIRQYLTHKERTTLEKVIRLKNVEVALFHKTFVENKDKLLFINKLKEFALEIEESFISY